PGRWSEPGASVRTVGARPPAEGVGGRGAGRPATAPGRAPVRLVRAAPAGSGRPGTAAATGGGAGRGGTAARLPAARATAPAAWRRAPTRHRARVCPVRAAAARPAG